MVHTKHYMTSPDGIRYAEAIDPTHLGREYTETDEPIVMEEASDYV